jgi:general secretion pathway protein D
MQLRRNPDVEPSIDELVRDYMGAEPPAAAPQPGDAVVQPAAEVIEPTSRQSSSVARPVGAPISGRER